MNLVFTICSNNYLAQAKVLYKSFREYHPNDLFVLGLVDRINNDVDYSDFDSAEVIPVEEINISNFEELRLRYNIVELNTAVKASYFLFLAERYTNVTKVVYLDPDIQIFQELGEVWNTLNDKSIILTPHIITPIAIDDKTPKENVFLNYGLYNLGFLALNVKSGMVINFLRWWEERILTFGFNRVHEGLFVDQLWINFIPIFQSDVCISLNPGMNMAPWNLHERVLTPSPNGTYLVNDKYQLIFYHFSSYNFTTPDLLCKEYYNRYDFTSRPDLVDIYQQYHAKLEQEGILNLSHLRCDLLLEHEIVEVRHTLMNKFRFWLFQMLPPILTKRLKYSD